VCIATVKSLLFHVRITIGETYQYATPFGNVWFWLDIRRRRLGIAEEERTKMYSMLIKSRDFCAVFFFSGSEEDVIIVVADAESD
jgi:hypothetical protein